jgi:ribokinase
VTGRVVVLGALNADLVAHVPRHPRPGETVLAHDPLRRLAGGKGGNQAVAAAAAGAEVTMVGAVGDDPEGRAYLERLTRLGVDVNGVRVRTDLPTGRAWVTVDEAGDNVVVVHPGANATDHDLGPLDRLRGGDVLLCQLEVPLGVVSAAVRRAASAGARVVVNAAPYAALPPETVAVADPLVVNEHEALALADSGAVPSSVLVTFGAAGCAWDGRHVTAVPVPAAEVVDTTGAGDAFCGALAAALAAGAGREDALRAAIAAGAAAVRHTGAQPDADL